MPQKNAAACLMGALVGDAAALGLHWIYDPARIAAVAQAQGHVAFTPLDPRHFDGVPSYFAHGLRPKGGMTQYGEVLHLAIKTLIAGDGRLDTPRYQQAYAAHFGPGGAYCGYVDRVTRGTLHNLAAGQTDPSGIDDDQLPAVASLPAIVVAGLGAEDLSTTIARAIRVTNVNDAALDYGMVVAALLSMVLDGHPVRDALHAVAAGTGGEIGAVLTAALTAPQASVDYAEITGRACHLPMGVPLAFHILARANSYADAIEINIRAGGDSAGRAIIIGAVMGAAHGLGGESGIPADYLLHLHDGATLWRNCQALANRT